ncbi:MAG: flagellar protein export ATPase FliI [Helicobacteraceae bacterium]|jgi:flagellum-specific ATP synthase|nr:flagellar protein export ATPase FliI [Helicobacteraceae bacterium]
MPLTQLRDRLRSTNLSVPFGRALKITSTHIVGSGLKVGIGDMVRVEGGGYNSPAYGMITAIEENRFIVTPFGFVEGLKTGDSIYKQEQGMGIGVGKAMLGRALNPFGAPIDGKEEIAFSEWRPMLRAPIVPMKRRAISEILETNVRSIDSFLTIGKGQKTGIFAGSGVGKSTLMGLIVRGSRAAIKVIALIGERGREVPEFIEESLRGDLTDTVVIAATSDDSPLMRKFGAFAAMSVAEYFKDLGYDVLFMMDSVTRFAMAQREIGLALGEPPTSKGYPPSVFSLLPQLMERAGAEKGKGSITAFFTVLVEGDDMNDPIADQARSILDGHIVLSRRLNDQGLYPPIDVLSSASRLMYNLINDDHKEAARSTRRILSLLRDNETLVRIGAYTPGSDKELDAALKIKPILEQFMSQNEPDTKNFDDRIAEMIAIVYPDRQKGGAKNG